MYTAHHPAPFTRNGTPPQPANAENTRGPRSRAGLKLAIVSGPTSEIKQRHRQPDRRRCQDLRARLVPLVASRSKITSSNTAVAMTSAPKAAADDIRKRASGVSGCPPGFG